MKRTVLAKKNSRSSTFSRKHATRVRRERRYVLCIQNEGYSASLEIGKVYERLPEDKGEKHGYIRVTDESGEDYLYPANAFVPIAVPVAGQKALQKAS